MDKKYVKIYIILFKILKNVFKLSYQTLYKLSNTLKRLFKAHLVYVFKN